MRKIILLLSLFTSVLWGYSQNNAAFVSQSVPSAVTPGQTFTVSITMRNTGTTSWTTSGEYKLGSQNPQDNTTWGTNRIYLDNSVTVNPGDEYTFTFDCTAPNTEGVYDFQWRMVQDGVEWFGDYTSNVQINVTNNPVNGAIFISQNVPTTVAPGQTFTVNITMRNGGTTTWTAADNYKLGSQNPEDNYTWGTNRIYLDNSVSVAPGDEYTFTFDCTAPNSEGVYDFQWRMVQDGVEWFGDYTPNVQITVANVNDAEFVSFSGVPERLHPGESFDVNITMRNTGTTTWTASDLYRLGTQDPTDNQFFGVGRLELPHDVAPGDTVTFSATLQASMDEGVYPFHWRMVQDGVEWFGDSTAWAFIPVINDLQDSLFTPSYNFHVDDHVIGTTFFHWYGPGDWQYSGPWIPIEGRDQWDGSVEFWKRMIKQLMMADIDVLYVIVIPTTELERGNLFMALYELRSEGWNVPKVCPFFDPIITYDLLGYHGDASTEQGKDEIVWHYIRFYRQYYAVNTDPYADDYIYTIDGHPVLNVWHVNTKIDNYEQMTRNDITSRLSAEFGAEHPIFNNSIRMITNEISPSFSFADEKVAQFELQEYYHETNYNGITTCLLKPGYWDKNVRDPGYILPRDGGSHYRDSWQQVVNNSSNINRVQIESFNEYDEGSGIFAARTDTIFRISTNTDTDVWSDSDDPYEYLWDTYVGARQFNVYEDYASTILWHNIPDTMLRGDTVWATVIVRNDGDMMWKGADDFKFGEEELEDPVLFGPTRYLIDDNTNEISTYRGIFRGRVIEFNIPIIAPDTIGTFMTHWKMLREGVLWFGDSIVKPITVVDYTNVPKQHVTRNIGIYPNPSNNGNFVIEGSIQKGDKIMVMNVTGKILFEKTVSKSTNKLSLDLGLIKGTYLVKLLGKKSVVTKKLLVN